MRKIEYNSQTALITDEEWQNMLDRFDVRQFEYDTDREDYVNNTECLLCKESYTPANLSGVLGSCERCPLLWFNPAGSAGCVTLMNSIRGVERAFYLAYTGSILYPALYKEPAERQLADLYKAVKGMPEVEGGEAE